MKTSDFFLKYVLLQGLIYILATVFFCHTSYGATTTSYPTASLGLAFFGSPESNTLVGFSGEIMVPVENNSFHFRYLNGSTFSTSFTTETRENSQYNLLYKWFFSQPLWFFTSITYAGIGVGIVENHIRQRHVLTNTYTTDTAINLGIPVEVGGKSFIGDSLVIGVDFFANFANKTTYLGYIFSLGFVLKESGEKR